nr:MAG: hypothetical protein [Totiviridae sp.]
MITIPAPRPVSTLGTRCSALPPHLVLRHCTVPTPRCLLPEPWMKEQSVQKIADRVAREIKANPEDIPTRPDNWPELLNEALANLEDDRYALAVFPAHSSQDLDIRYVRAADVWSFYLEHGRHNELRRALHQLRFFDYITMVNVLTAKIMFVCPLWWDTLERAGCTGAEHFRLASRALSDIIKKERVALEPDDRVAFYETASLYGAMCPPVPGWDPVEETQAPGTGWPR